MSFCSSPLPAELMAIREATRFASRQPQKQMEIETDCKNATDLCENLDGGIPWEAATVVIEIQ